MFDQLVTSVSGVSGSTPVHSSTDVKTHSSVSASSDDFGDVLARMAADTVDTVKAAEAVSISGLQGKASVQQVVESVMAAEQSLQTAIAIRDKVVSAYMEISRMTI